MKLGKWENEMKGERGLKGKHGQARQARGGGGEQCKNIA